MRVWHTSCCRLFDIGPLLPLAGPRCARCFRHWNGLANPLSPRTIGPSSRSYAPCFIEPRSRGPDAGHPTASIWCQPKPYPPALMTVVSQKPPSEVLAWQQGFQCLISLFHEWSWTASDLLDENRRILLRSMKAAALDFSPSALCSGVATSEWRGRLARTGTAHGLNWLSACPTWLRHGLVILPPGGRRFT